MILKDPKSTSAFSRSWTFQDSARQCFELILDQIPREKRKILLPAYIGYTKREGSGVFDPVRKTKSQYEFYSLDKQLTPDHDGIINKLSTGNFGALLVIHYFGFCQVKIKELATYCKEHNILLIEDCAHTLGGKYNGKDLGSYGDFSFHSLHKVLPLNNGGLLKANTDHVTFKDHCEEEVLSVFAKSDLEKINAKRVENYKKMADALKKTEGIELLFSSSVPDGIVPHNLPIIVKNGLREKLYFKLIEQEVPVTALYYCMIREILIQDFPNAHYVAENILNIPIHQEVTDENISEIARKIEDSLKMI
jgi:dTDP-4-amino-4,6-dideoxygalactose transaminase